MRRSADFCVFVEGGGTQKRTQTACRKAFHILIEKVLGDKPKSRIVASGSRDEAYRDFCRALTDGPKTYALLLVDSEGPVLTGTTRTGYLRKRDQWTETMPEDQLHLMVQCMEAWFLADRQALVSYYGDDFLNAALPGNPRIEEIPKQDIFNALNRATGRTQKGAYHKTRHGFEILASLDPDKIRAQSPHAEKFFQAIIVAFVLAVLSGR